MLFLLAQRPTESVWDFHCRFRKLLLRWPGEFSTQQQLSAFCEGLMLLWREIVASFEPKTVQKAYKIAEQHEHAKQAKLERRKKLARDVYTVQVCEDSCVDDNTDLQPSNDRLVAANLATSSTYNTGQGTVSLAALMQSNVDVIS